MNPHLLLEITSGNALTNIKCNKCDKELANKTEFTQLKKRENRQNVPGCINIPRGTCVFGEDKCWIRHNTTVKDDQIMISK